MDDITVELAKFRGMQGTFAVPTVQKQTGKCAGYMWWDTFGAGCPTLQWLAVRILPQTTSAAAAKVAWSEFDFVFDRRRNRMGKERARLSAYGFILGSFIASNIHAALFFSNCEYWGSKSSELTR